MLENFREKAGLRGLKEGVDWHLIDDCKLPDSGAVINEIVFHSPDAVLCALVNGFTVDMINRESFKMVDGNLKTVTGKPVELDLAFFCVENMRITLN